MKRPITNQVLKVLLFMAESERTAQEVAQLLVIENESACGNLWKLKQKGFVDCRNGYQKNKNSHVVSRKKYFLTDKGKAVLADPQWETIIKAIKADNTGSNIKP